MIRQLFASAGGVSEGRGPGRAAPFSVALHAAAIGVLILLSQQKVSSHEEPHGPVVYQPTAAPAAATAMPVKVDIVRPPKLGGGAPPKAPEPAASTPKPFVQPPVLPDQLPSHESDNDPPAVGNPTSTGTDAGCTGAGCAAGNSDPNGVPGGDPNAPPMPVLSAGVEAPHKIHDVMPVYPEPARRIHLEGRVQVECVIGPDGHVRDMRIASHSNAIFDASALDAVRQWVYSTPRFNGQPVSVLMTVTVRFTIRY
jgi:periplasmic protein TonB